MRKVEKAKRPSGLANDVGWAIQKLEQELPKRLDVRKIEYFDKFCAPRAAVIPLTIKQYTAGPRFAGTGAKVWMRG
jgi:hypothetical protein